MTMPKREFFFPMHAAKKILFLAAYTTLFVSQGIYGEDAVQDEFEGAGANPLLIRDQLSPKKVKINAKITFISAGSISLFSIFTVWFCRRKSHAEEHHLDKATADNNYNGEQHQLGIASAKIINDNWTSTPEHEYIPTGRPGNKKRTVKEKTSKKHNTATSFPGARMSTRLGFGLERIEE